VALQRCLEQLQRAPANHQQLVAFDCTTSVAAPVLDAVWGGLNLAGALAAASGNDRSWSGPSDRGTTFIVGMGWAVISGVAAGYGFVHTRVCRQAKDEIHDCPPVLLIIARADDGWLATWSRADAVVSHPIDPAALAQALAGLMRQRAADVAAAQA